MPFDPNTEIFPQELFNLIIECAKDDRRTLCNLSLVSKAFLTDSRRFLYQRVVLGGVRVMKGKRDGWAISTVNNDTVFFRTLARTPCLAYYVREFSFRPDTRYRGDHFWCLFRQALHQMVNLKCLQLTLMAIDGNLFRILEELCNRPFQLERFSWKDYRWTMNVHELVALVSFLSSQPHLQVLDFLSNSSSIALPRACCPNLTTFAGSYEVALNVLRDRPITNFIWTGGQIEPVSPLSLYWQTELSKLRVLVFRDYFPTLIDIAELVSCLQSLEALQISFTNHHIPPKEAVLKVSRQMDFI